MTLGPFWTDVNAKNVFLNHFLNLSRNLSDLKSKTISGITYGFRIIAPEENFTPTLKLTLTLN